MKWILVLVLAALFAVAAVEATPSPPTGSPTKAPSKSPTKSPTKAPTHAPTTLPTSSPTYYCPNSDANTTAFGVSDIVIMAVSILLTTYAWMRMTYNKRVGMTPYIRAEGFFDEKGEFLMLFFWATILKYAVCATFFGLTLYYFFISCSPTEVPRIFNQYSQAGSIAVWVIILGCVDTVFMGMHAGAFERWVESGGKDTDYVAVPSGFPRVRRALRRFLDPELFKTEVKGSEDVPRA